MSSLSPDRITSILSALIALASMFGYALPEAKRADANRDANFSARDALADARSDLDLCNVERVDWKNRYLETDE